jgi:hypothetical protein
MEESLITLTIDRGGGANFFRAAAGKKIGADN